MTFRPAVISRHEHVTVEVEVGYGTAGGLVNDLLGLALIFTQLDVLLEKGVLASGRD